VAGDVSLVDVKGNLAGWDHGDNFWRFPINFEANGGVLICMHIQSFHLCQLVPLLLVVLVTFLTCSHLSRRGKCRAISMISFTTSFTKQSAVPAKAVLVARPERMWLINPWLSVAMCIQGSESSGKSGIGILKSQWYARYSSRNTIRRGSWPIPSDQKLFAPQPDAMPMQHSHRSVVEVATTHPNEPAHCPLPRHPTSTSRGGRLVVGTGLVSHSHGLGMRLPRAPIQTMVKRCKQSMENFVRKEGRERLHQLDPR
jgi:hypothetical protein